MIISELKALQLADFCFERARSLRRHFDDNDPSGFLMKEADEWDALAKAIERGEAVEQAHT